MKKIEKPEKCEKRQKREKREKREKMRKIGKSYEKSIISIYRSRLRRLHDSGIKFVNLSNKID